MRLIDADALMAEFQENQKEFARTGIEYASCFMSAGRELSTEWYCVEDMLDNAPAIDAVPVVRCRECENWETDWEPNYFNPDNPMYYCAETDIFPSGNWFCADGQRREEDT